MENLTFVNEEEIPLINQDEDYDDYRTPDTSRVDTSFIDPDTIEVISTLRLRQKVKWDKLTALYRHLNVTGDIDLIDLDRFRLTKDLQKRVTIFEFYKDNRWIPLTKQTGEFCAPKTLMDSFGGVNRMKNFLGIKRTPPAWKRSISAASNLKSELPTDLQMESIPLEELSSSVEDIDVQTREASQNTDLDMREFLGIDKTLQSKQGEL